MDDFWQLPAFKDMKISIMQKKAFSIENRYFGVETKVNYKAGKVRITLPYTG